MKKIRKISRLYYLFAGSFIMLAIFATILGIFIIFQLDEVTELHEKTTEALLVSQLALDFNVENFHTQLEVWEYAYEPTHVRLIAFQKHDERLVELSEELLDVVERDSLLRQGAGLVPGGGKKISKIISDLQLVRNDWVGLFEEIAKLEDSKARGSSKGDVEYEVLEEAILKRIIENEALFDALEFNKEIDEFVQDQEDFFNSIYVQPEEILSRFITLLTILVTLIFILGVIAPLFLRNLFVGEEKR